MYRDDVINYFIKKYNFKRYLEIGVFEGGNIKKIDCPHKDGVDPGAEGVIAPEVNYNMTSNEFFEKHAPNNEKYDIVFIDGLHHHKQVTIDIDNALLYTTDNAIIVLHDCNPISLNHTLIPRIQAAWQGDTYKAVLEFQKNNTKHLYFTIDYDWGLGVIVKNHPISNKLYAEEYDRAIIDWTYFEHNRKQLLNLLSINNMEDLYNPGLGIISR